MRGVANALNYWRHLRASKALVAGVFGLAMLATGGILMYQQPANDAGASNHCNQWKVMRCGMKNRQHLENAWQNNHQGDMRAIYRSMGANARQAANQGQWGTVDRSGNITVNGRVVARDAQTVYRSGNGTTPQTVPDTLQYYGMQQGRVLVVMDNQNQFDYAVMKNCGNPVTANPTPAPEPEPEPQPQPKPEPQPQPKPEPEPQPKPQPKPEPQPEPQMQRVRVCNPETGETIRVREDRADQYAPVGSPECQPEPAPQPQPEPEQPPEPPQQPEQPPQQPEQPEEIPSTGPVSALTGMMGLGSLAYGGHSWLQSRRQLGNAFKK